MIEEKYGILCNLLRNEQIQKTPPSDAFREGVMGDGDKRQTNDRHCQPVQIPTD